MSGREYAQILGVGADDLNRLRGILGCEPVRILARCSSPPWSKSGSGATTEAFVEMTGGLHVHYHGCLASHRQEHSLWLEGDQGVLWTDRTLIWWRKRGWPVFVPIPSRGRATPDAVPEDPARVLETFQAAVKAGRQPDGSQSGLWALSIAESAIRSDRTRTTVAIGDLFDSSTAPGVVPAT